MGKKGGAKRLPNSTSGSHAAISLREEATGKVQTKAISNIKSMLKLEHLKRLALWACEASIPSLGAFYGQHLANVGEAMGISPDPSLTSCQRCESVLHPGFNCTVRIQKNRAKARCRNKKPVTSTQNNVVYKCHFCSHNNLKRGTLKAHMKGICPSKEKSSLEIKPRKAMVESASFKQGTTNIDEVKEKDGFALQDAARDISMTDSPATPSVSSSTASLEGKNRKRNKKRIEPGSMSAQPDAGMIIGTSSKKRRKSWTSLKEIAKSSEQDKSRAANLTIPFLL